MTRWAFSLLCEAVGKICALVSHLVVHLIVCRFDPQTGLLTGSNDLNLVNLFLRLFGKCTEEELCVRLLCFQVSRVHQSLTVVQFTVWSRTLTPFHMVCRSNRVRQLSCLFLLAAMMCRACAQ